MTTARKQWVSWEEFDALFPGLSPYSVIDFQRVGGLTAGSIPFADAEGLLDEDNANLFWDAANIRLGIGTPTPDVTLDIEFPAVVSIVSRVSAKTRPWRHWECIDGNWGLAIGIHADDNIIHFHYDTPIGTLDTCMMVFDGGNTRVGILEDTPLHPLDVGGNTRIQGNFLVTGTFGEITVADGSSINLQEDIQFTGGNGVNIIYFPDNLAAALQLREGANAYISFRTSNGTEGISIYKTLTCYDIIIDNGYGLSLQEDITFTGTTGVNLINFPDNLAVALDFKEAGNSYLLFKTTNAAEAVVFGKVFTGVSGSTIGTLTLADGSITDSGGTISFGNENLSTTGTLGCGVLTVSPAGSGILIQAGNPTAGTTFMAGGYGTFGEIRGAGVFFGDNVVASTTVSDRIDIANTHAIIGARAIYMKYAIGITFHTLDASVTAGNAFSSERVRINEIGNVGIGQTTFGNNATKTLALGTGVAPTTSPADCFQMYSADIGGAAGKAGVHFRDEEGNVVSLGSGGVLMTGTAKVTKCFQFANAALGKGGTKPDEIIVGNYWGWSYDINDDSVLTIKLPDDWASGTDVLIYIRWAINEAYVTNSGEVRWQATWVAHPADMSEAIDDAGTTDNSGDINIPANAYTLTQTLIETIPAANLAAGDEIGITIKRVTLGDGNDPTADPVVTCIGFVYTIDKLGTPT